MKQTRITGILILTCLATVGCQTESQRMANLADRTIEMQSQQNSTIAKTRESMVKFNRDIQTERKHLSRGFTQLENDRRDLHQLRRSELAWAESFRFMAIVIAASMPLFLCAYLVWVSTRRTGDAELINEALMLELVTKTPRLIAGPNRPTIESQPDPRSTEAEHSFNCNNQLLENK